MTKFNIPKKNIYRIKKSANYFSFFIKLSSRCQFEIYYFFPQIQSQNYVLDKYDTNIQNGIGTEFL